jgi:hypothetical protein
MYSEFKARVLTPPAHPIGDGECVSLIVNNPASYTALLFPGVTWEDIIAPVINAKDIAGKSNQYLTWIPNVHSNPNQLPAQGDIGVSGATPVNSAGHCWIFDSATPNGISILQQNTPETGEGPNITAYSWTYRPVLGWYHPNFGPAPDPTPAPAPAPSGQTITLPKTTGPWHLYAPGFAGNMAHVLGPIEPEVLHEDLTYAIIASLGNGVYRIQSEDYGIGDLFTNGSDVVIK